MKILAVDTSALTASAALAFDGKLTGLYTLNAAHTHSETLLPMVESLLSNLKITVDDLDMLAVTDGPGSFTGIRIGISLIKGLAFGKNIPCVGVSTLEALAQNAASVLKPGDLAVPVMDARRSQLYNAVFVKNDDGSLTRLCDDRQIPVSELESELANFPKTLQLPEPPPRSILFTGDGYQLLRKSITAPLNIIETPETLKFQNAYSVALCAERKYLTAADKSIFTDSAIKPIYLRAPQAERERLEREAKSEQNQK